MCGRRRNYDLVGDNDLAQKVLFTQAGEVLYKNFQSKISQVLQSEIWRIKKERDGDSGSKHLFTIESQQTPIHF